MIEHKLIQGSEEWHQFRREHRPASEAPMVMGISPYRSRTELLTIKKSGVSPEPTEQELLIFSLGHEAELKARARAEELIEDDLFSLTGSEGIYSASFDGITMCQDVIWEHKMLNDSIREATDIKQLPKHYKAQMEQQLRVSGAEKCLFLATKWDGDFLVEEKFFWYEPDENFWQQIEDAWEQFEKDLIDFEPTEYQAKPVGNSPDDLPALVVRVTGQVTESNLDDFRQYALDVIRGINTDLQTDQDFADAEKTIKWCTKAEQRLEETKERVLAQTATIDELFRTLDGIKEEAREQRLALTKLVNARKLEIKRKIAKDALENWDADLNTYPKETLGFLDKLIVVPDFASAFKNKKTLDSMKESVNLLLAEEKIKTKNLHLQIKEKRLWMQEQELNDRFAQDKEYLKPLEDFKAIVLQRKSEHDDQVKKAALELEERQKQKMANVEAAVNKISEQNKALAEKKPPVDTIQPKPLPAMPVAKAKTKSNSPNDVPTPNGETPRQHAEYFIELLQTASGMNRKTLVLMMRQIDWSNIDE